MGIGIDKVIENRKKLNSSSLRKLLEVFLIE